MVVHFHDKKINLKNIIFVKDCYVVANTQSIYIITEDGKEQNVYNGLPDWLKNNYEVLQNKSSLTIQLGLNL